MSCSSLRAQLSSIKSLIEAVDALAPKMKKEDEPLRENVRSLMAKTRERITSLRESLIPREFKELMATEQQKLSAFFGSSIEVPPLPKDITRERFHEWQKLGFELHYLPAMEMTKDKDFPGWTKKPGASFYDEIKNGNIARSSLVLNAGWLLIDGRQKPEYNDGKQQYDNDPFTPIIKKLRQGQNPLIQKYRHTIDASRFGISWDELHKPEVKQAFAKTINLTPDQLSLPRAIEWNILGNIHHPEWGETYTWEWFEDSYEGGWRRLNGGDSRGGGLSFVLWDHPDYRSGNLGFRLLGRFP